MFLLAWVPPFSPLHTHTHPTSSSFRLASSSASGYVRCLTTESGESGCHGRCKKCQRSGSPIVPTPVYFLHMLGSSEWDDSALPLSAASFIGAIFATNKCVHCETRQINSDWSTCIEMSLSSKINMFVVLKLRDIFSLMFFVENADNHAFACSDNVRII